MSEEGILIVSQAHFDQVVLRSTNSSLKNEVGAIFVNDPANDGFYRLCVSLGHLLKSLAANQSWRPERHAEALHDVAAVLGEIKTAQGFDRAQLEQLLTMAAANLDFCVDVQAPEDAPSEMALSAGQQMLLELQGRLRKSDDALRQAILVNFL